MKEDVGIVLIHGDGLGPYIWKDLTPLINLPVLPVHYPSTSHSGSVANNYTLDNYAESIQAQIES